MTDALVEAVARVAARQHYIDASNVPIDADRTETLVDANWDFWAGTATAALQAVEAAGYRVVPVEASEGMVNAGIDQTVIIRADDTEVRSVWAAMLSAAPRVGDL